MNIGDPANNIVLPGLRRKLPSANTNHRIPFINWMPAWFRAEFIAAVAEFVGTFLFLFFGFSITQIANSAPTNQTPPTSDLFYIALGFGFSLMVNAWVFFRITGGLFNPAVTLGMCLIGAVPWTRGGVVFVSQIIGAIASAGVVSALFPGPMGVNTTLGAGTSIARGLFIEMFLTAELVFTIFMLAAEKHKATFIAPIGIGLSLFICELAGVQFTGGSLNPARSFGPSVVLGSFPGYHWIYWVGPALGTLLATAFYKFVKSMEYEIVNPGQDATDEGEDAQQKEEAEEHIEKSDHENESGDAV